MATGAASVRYATCPHLRRARERSLHGADGRRLVRQKRARTECRHCDEGRCRRRHRPAARPVVPLRRRGGGMNRHDVIIDTDPGVDDAVAILAALASPEINLLGLTVVAGNVALPDAAANACRIIALSG